MKNNPLVSVIVPLYNYSKFIKYCIKSIIKQDYNNYEIIVIDDCSTDNSYEVAKKYECDNIKIMRLDKNSGYSTAKNEGIITSQGDCITCLDADDMLTRNSLTCRVKAMLDHNVPFVHGRAIDVYGDISLKECYKIKENITRTKAKIHAQSVLLQRWVHQKYGLYDEKLRSRSDKEMWLRLFGSSYGGDKYKSPCRVKRTSIKDDVAYYRRHQKSMISMRNKNASYDKKVTKLLYQQYELRKNDGITSKNTRFLES